MPDYNGYLFSPATANAKCSYCGADLKKLHSMRLESKEDVRYICPQCLINILDAVSGMSKESHEK